MRLKQDEEFSTEYQWLTWRIAAEFQSTLNMPESA